MRTERWIESLWEGKNTTAREEEKKEEVLSVFRELVRESGSAGEAASTCPGNRYGSGRLGSVSLPTCAPRPVRMAFSSTQPPVGHRAPAAQDRYPRIGP
jgi:hypothetical protein